MNKASLLPFLKTIQEILYSQVHGSENGLTFLCGHVSVTCLVP